MDKYTLIFLLMFTSLFISAQNKFPFGADVNFYQDSVNPLKVHLTVTVCVPTFWPFSGKYINIMWGDSGGTGYEYAPSDTSSFWAFGDSTALDSAGLGVMHFYAEHTFPDSISDSIVYQDIYISQRLPSILNLGQCQPNCTCRFIYRFGNKPFVFA